jgi:hypothetical protein
LQVFIGHEKPNGGTEIDRGKGRGSWLFVVRRQKGQNAKLQCKIQNYWAVERSIGAKGVLSALFRACFRDWFAQTNGCPLKEQPSAGFLQGF